MFFGVIGLGIALLLAAYWLFKKGGEEAGKSSGEQLSRGLDSEQLFSTTFPTIITSEEPMLTEEPLDPLIPPENTPNDRDRDRDQHQHQHQVQVQFQAQIQDERNQENLEQEKKELEKREYERKQREKLEQEQREKLEQEQREHEKREQEKLEKEKREQEQRAKVKLEQDKRDEEEKRQKREEEEKSSREKPNQDNKKNNSNERALNEQETSPPSAKKRIILLTDDDDQENTTDQNDNDKITVTDDQSLPTQRTPTRAAYKINIRYGMHDIQGRRDEMEDKHSVVHNIFDKDEEADTGQHSVHIPNPSNHSTYLRRGANRYRYRRQAFEEEEEEQKKEEEPPAPEEPKKPKKVQEIFSSGEDWARKVRFIAVYDGHGGKRASDFAANHLHKFLSEEDSEEFLSNPEKSLRRAFLRTEEAWLDKAYKEQLEDGTTGVVALLFGNTLLIGNIGDSEAVLSRNGTAVNLTTLHNPSKNPSEAKRVVAAGGRLYHNRVGHPHLNATYFNIAVSRAIGDISYKHPEFTSRKTSGMIAEPSLHREELSPTDQFMILACDGLWDVFTHQEAIDFVSNKLASGLTDPQTITESLVNEAFEKESLDNITAAVVLFEYLPNEEVEQLKNVDSLSPISNEEQLTQTSSNEPPLLPTESTTKQQELLQLDGSSEMELSL